MSNFRGMGRSSGLTLIEVMVALVVFLIAGSALISGSFNLFATNRVSIDTEKSTLISRDFLSISRANPSLKGSLNGMGFGTAGSGVSSTAFKTWWATSTSGNPLLTAATVSTNPATCQAGQPCAITLGLTWNQPGSVPITRTFVMQDGF
jgi:prepilin-type N-terminal cleavage/methylation domain-containing protein